MIEDIAYVPALIFFFWCPKTTLILFFFKKARTGGFKKSIKKRFSFSLRELFKKFVSPIVDGVRGYQKKRQLLKSRKIKEEEKRKQKEIKVQSDLRKELLKKEIKEEIFLRRFRVYWRGYKK